MEVIARIPQPNFQIFYKNFQERFSPKLLHFVNATVYDALHERAIGSEPA
jgi:hypothetical protein